MVLVVKNLTEVFNGFLPPIAYPSAAAGCSFDSFCSLESLDSFCSFDSFSSAAAASSTLICSSYFLAGKSELLNLFKLISFNDENQ